MTFVTTIFGFIMKQCYIICGNYGLAIIFFTLLSKIILLPVSVWVQKNSIKMVRIQPEINYMKVRLFGDRDAIAEEQSKIYKKEHYHPLLSVIPMIIQLLILVGVIEAIKAGIADPMVSMDFCGIDLSKIPQTERGLFILSPIAAGVSALILSLTQNMSNVLQAEQNKWSQYGMLALSVGLSLYLGWFVSVGVALYWIASNLMAVAQMYILNAVISPKKYVDYEKLQDSKKKLAELEHLGDQKKKQYKPYAKKEREDYKRFFSVVNKHLVFYSEGKGFYKYYQGIIEYLLNNTKLTIHYITSDPEDSVFELSNTYERLKTYYIGEKRLITLMMKMDVDMVVMTMPDLENYHIKRSLVRKDIEYVYIPHGMDSLNLTMRTGSMDHYDTIFCVGPHQKEENEKIGEVYGLPKRNMVEWGYSLLDRMTEDYEAGLNQEADKKDSKEAKKILIAPSWQEDNIVDSCLEEILNLLKETEYHIIVRPHPQHVRHRGEFIEGLKEKYKDNPLVEIQTDFSSNRTVFEADILITDWSGIAYEYAYTTKKPVLFINTPMKVMNPEYQKIDTVPLNILLRDEIGCSVDTDQLDALPRKVDELLSARGEYHAKIEKFVDTYVYNHGKSSQIGAEYMIESIQRKINERKKENEK